MVFDKPYQTLKMGLDHFSARLFTIYNDACELSLALSYGVPVTTRWAIGDAK